MNSRLSIHHFTHTQLQLAVVSLVMHEPVHTGACLVDGISDLQTSWLHGTMKSIHSFSSLENIVKAM